MKIKHTVTHMTLIIDVHNTSNSHDKHTYHIISSGFRSQLAAHWFWFSNRID
uniref:Uncharacterized protein n=1 Tax=Anguilla anguilla TaxID=7936 RepID=A0A0E9T6A7_ANGAN